MRMCLKVGMSGATPVFWVRVPPRVHRIDVVDGLGGDGRPIVVESVKVSAAVRALKRAERHWLIDEKVVWWGSGQPLYVDSDTKQAHERGKVGAVVFMGPAVIAARVCAGLSLDPNAEVRLEFSPFGQRRFDRFLARLATDSGVDFDRSAALCGCLNEMEAAVSHGRSRGHWGVRLPGRRTVSFAARLGIDLVASQKQRVDEGA